MAAEQITIGDDTLQVAKEIRDCEGRYLGIFRLSETNIVIPDQTIKDEEALNLSAMSSYVSGQGPRYMMYSSSGKIAFFLWCPDGSEQTLKSRYLYGQQKFLDATLKDLQTKLFGKYTIRNETEFENVRTLLSRAGFETQ